MITIGVTGTFGSGKSTLCKIWKKAGYKIIDADVITRQITDLHPEVKDEIIKSFGRSVINSDGSIDRKALADLVFNDSAALGRLNKMLHPSIIAEIRRQIEQYVKEGEEIVIIEIPLLFEADLAEEYDRIITVVAAEPVIIDRLTADGWNAEHSKQRINSQMSQEEKAVGADYVIENTATIEDLEREAELVIDSIRRSFLENEQI